MSRRIWIAGLVFVFTSRAFSQTANDALTEAYYIHAGMEQVVNLEKQLRTLTPTVELIRPFVDSDRFKGVLEKVHTELRSKNVDLNFGSEWEASFDQVHAELESTSPDLKKAKTVALDAYRKVLNVAYDAIAAKDQWVAEGKEVESRYIGWTKLTEIRIKQLDFVSAQKALWGAYGALDGKGTADDLTFIESLANQVAQGLIDQGKTETVKEHILKMSAVPTLANAATSFQAKLALLEDTNQVRAFAGSSSFSQLFDYADKRLAANPKDENFLNVLVTELTTLNVAANLAQWAQQSSVCGARLYVLERLQKLNEPYLDLAQAAISCDEKNPAAQTQFKKAKILLARQSWSKLSDKPLKDAAIISIVKDVKALLDEASKIPASSNPPLDKNLAEFKTIVANYEAARGKRQEVAQKSEGESECVDFYNSAKWVNQNATYYIEITKVLAALKDLTTKTSKCAPHFNDLEKAEMGRWLPNICANESNRLGWTMSAVPDDKRELVFAQIEEFLKYCKPSIASAELKRLEGVLPARTGG